ncbi:MAG: hypothetical protein ACI80V_002870 [Rhodothermales bacterium]|jgi:hypothetical protein
MAGQKMIRKQIYVTPEQDRLLAIRAMQLGCTQSEVIRMAIQNVADTYSLEAKEQVLKDVAGVWKDRTDLPDFDAMRMESDARLELQGFVAGYNRPG